MITFKEKYEDSGSIFPRHDVPVKKKLTPEWMKRYCEALYCSWLNGATKISYSDVEKIQENRRFMRGEQDPETYRKMFLGDAADSEIDFIRKGLMNIDWTPPAIAPKYVNIIQNMFHDTNFEVLVNALDEKSTKEKGAKKWKLWVQSQMKDAIEAVNKQVEEQLFGIPDVLPESIEELEFMESVGAFRLAKELAFEAAVVEAMRRCDMPEINKKVINDFFAIGKAVTRDYVDPITQKVNVEYCDIARTIIDYQNSDHYDPDKAAVIKEYSIASLMASSGLTEDQAREVAHIYYGAGNYSNGWDFYDRDTGEGEYGWSRWNVQVMEAEFESVDVNIKEVINKNKHGNKAVYSISEQKAEKTKNPVEKLPVRVRYRCSWVVGTDHVFDYGYQYDVPRKTPDQAGSSFHFYDVGKPFIEILKPHINQATLAWYRVQNTITNAAESGLIIDYDSFDNMVMSGKVMKPSELIKLGKTSGTWIHKKRGFSNVVNTQAQDPVKYFEGGAGRQLQENIDLYRWNIQAIEEQLGMPPIASAGRQERETTLGEQQIMFASSTNAVKHFATGVKHLVKDFCTNCILRIQIVAKHNPEGYNAIVNSIGYEKAQILKIGAADAACEMGVEILPIYGATQKESIYTAALQSMQAGKSGGVGIRMSDFMKIKRMLESGLIRAAENWLVFSEEKEIKRQMQMQRENMALNAQAAQQAEQQKGKNKLDQIAAQTQGDIAAKDQEIAGQIIADAVAAGGEQLENQGGYEIY